MTVRRRPGRDEKGTAGVGLTRRRLGKHGPGRTAWFPFHDANMFFPLFLHPKWSTNMDWWVNVGDPVNQETGGSWCGVVGKAERHQRHLFKVQFQNDPK